MAPYPDLQASAVAGPTKGFVLQKVLVSWTDTNSGTLAANGTWEDDVYIANNAQGTGKSLLGRFSVTDTLAVGDSIDRTQEVTLPATPGEYWFFVTTNAANSLQEGENGNNNTAVSADSVVVTATPLPNLFVTSITPPTSTVFSGQTFPISFVVTNEGTAPTSVPIWQDWIVLSQDPTIAQTFNVNDDRSLIQQPFITSANNVSYLGPGQSYTQTVNVTLPNNAQGAWYVYVSPDGTGNHHRQAMPELQQTGKVAVSSTFNVQLSPVPDLTVPSVQAPQQLFSGQSATVSWTVKNTGNGPTGSNSWNDSIYLSSSPTLDVSATLLASAMHQGTLASQGSYTGSANVTLPVGISGAYYIFVKTDSGAQVFENGATFNNVGATPTASTVNLTPPPDFTVTAVSVPTVGTSGQGATVAYTVHNAGAGPTDKSSWGDAFYLSPTPTFDANTARYIGANTHLGALAAGASYSDSYSFDIPTDVAGARYVLVKVDYASAVFELDRTNNFGVSGNAIQIADVPPDLIVTGVGAPSIAVPGTGVNISWTVENQGTGTTASSLWHDKIYLSTSNIIDDSAVLLDTVAHSGALAGGATYSQSRLVTLPINVSGSYKIIVQTNSAGEVVESSTTNNLAIASITLDTQNDGGGGGPDDPPAAIADLRPTALTGPTSIVAGSNITANWTVENVGTGSTNSNYWYDDVWLSTHSTLGSGGSDVYLGSLQHNNALAPGGSYSATKSFALPTSLIGGTYYLIVSTDRPTATPLSATGVNLVFESNESNNNRAASLTASVTPLVKSDLTITSTTAPTTATAGGSLSVQWTVKNNGGDTGNNSISDGVYLSYDSVFDSSDRLIGYLNHAGGLAAGASYDASKLITLPTGVAGTFRVFVVTNLGQYVDESNFANDTAIASQPLVISLPAPADLVAGSLAVPVNALAGQDLSISYQVTNGGANTANGSWVDSLYLSSTSTWDASDTLLGKVSQTRTLAPGDTYTGTLDTTLPGVKPGSYYVILRTNILNNFSELTQANNLSVSLTQTLIDAPSITLGTPVTGDLTAGQYAYYKLSSASNQTLQFALTGLAGASNELYISYGTMPTRTQYDYRFKQPLTSDQTVIVPNAKSGSYYVLVYGDSLPGVTTSESYTLLATAKTFSIASISPSAVDNGGPSTFEIDGARFDRGVTFTLTDGSGRAIDASSVLLTDSSTAYATFDLTGKALGSYTLSARLSDGTTTQLSGSGVTINDVGTPSVFAPTNGAITGWLETYFQPPTVVLPNRIGSVTITWINTAKHDITVPLLKVTSPSGNAIGLDTDHLISDAYVWFMGVSPEGPAGILRPGESVSRTLYYRSASTAGTNNLFKLQVFQADDPIARDLKPYLPDDLTAR